VLHRLSLAHRFVLFVPDFPDFENFMYLDQDCFGSSIYLCSLGINSAGHESQYLYLCKEWDEDIVCKRCPFSL
jgi:hypothetical protein